VSEREGLAGDFRRGVDQDALVVNDLNDDSFLAGVGAVVEEDDTADFNEPPLSGLYIDGSGHGVAYRRRFEVKKAVAKAKASA